MAVAVCHLIVVVDEVPAVDVVCVAVAIIVDGVAAGLVGIGPDVCGQIGMVDVDAGVDHRHHDVLRTRRQAPGPGGVDVVAAGAGILAVVLQVPLGCQKWVVRQRSGPDRKIGLEPGHGLRAGRPAEHGLSGCTRRRERKESSAERAGMPSGMPGGELPDEHRASIGRLGSRRSDGSQPTDPLIDPRLDGMPSPFDPLDAGRRRDGHAGEQRPWFQPFRAAKPAGERLPPAANKIAPWPFHARLHAGRSKKSVPGLLQPGS